MRTIKFRAWDKTSNRMMDWLHLQTDNEFRDFQFLLFESDQFIFLQFTGLLDKNGKEIYEGDIVRNFEMQLAHHTIEWVIDGRCDWVKIERLKMSVQEYQSVPATQEAASLLRDSGNIIEELFSEEDIRTALEHC